MSDDRPERKDTPSSSSGDPAGPDRDARVPESWRGYLAEDVTPGADRAGGTDRAGGRDRAHGRAAGDAPSDDPLSTEQREWLERSLRGEGDGAGPGSVPPGADRPLDERGVPRSRAEGVSFGGLIPFFLLLALALGVFIFFSWQEMKPRPYDTSGFGPPDKTVEVVARDLFRDVVAGRFDPALMVNDFQLGAIGLRTKGSPFGRSHAWRYRDTIDRVKGGTYQIVDPTPQPAPELDAVMFLEYERTDLTTQQQRHEKLWFGRVEDGWRVIGFQ